ncbi:MAG: metallophosphoesterase family protein [Rhodobacterales bacterium]
MKLISGLFGQKKPNKKKPVYVAAAYTPERPLYVVGDIHGCYDLLELVIDRIVEDAGDVGYDLVFVGDYIDRGEHSRAVIETLHKISQLAFVTCLCGNHERLLTGFLDDPAKNGRRWMRNGGLQTLASFGVGGVTETSSDEAMQLACDQFRTALGPYAPWLRALPVSFVSGNIFVTHAGANPNLPIEAQPEKTLLWGHPAFLREPRLDGIWVVHGHTIIDEPVDGDSRISIDTGAYATGRLTVAKITNAGVTFSVGSKPVPE